MCVIVIALIFVDSPMLHLDVRDSAWISDGELSSRRSPQQPTYDPVYDSWPQQSQAQYIHPQQGIEVAIPSSQMLESLPSTTPYYSAVAGNQKSSLQLWRFLVAMLDDPNSQHLICWTGRTLEFKLNEPEEVRELCKFEAQTAAHRYIRYISHFGHGGSTYSWCSINFNSRLSIRR